MLLVGIISVIDCQVGDWSDWSKCDVACGIGTSTRTREVLRPESNGGRQCPELEENRSCRATKCSTRTLDKVSALKGIQNDLYQSLFSHKTHTYSLYSKFNYRHDIVLFFFMNREL